MIAAATAPSSPTTLLALACRISHPLVALPKPRHGTVLELEGRVRPGPCTPSILVVASNSAYKSITSVEHEGRFLEVVHVNGPDREHAWQVGKVGIVSTCSNALHLILVDWCTRLGRFPAHLRF